MTAECGVFPGFFEESRVAALLDDFSLLEKDDLVCLADGAEAMGDDESGPILHQLCQGELNLSFGLHVDARSGLVENHEGRGFQRCPGYGDSLLFSHAQANAPFSDEGVPSFGKTIDEILGLGDFQSLFNFFVACFGVS